MIYFLKSSIEMFVVLRRIIAKTLCPCYLEAASNKLAEIIDPLSQMWHNVCVKLLLKCFDGNEYMTL